MRLTLRLAAAFALWLLLAAGALAQDATLKRAADLINARDAQAAYDLLKPLEPERAGDPEFDILLGSAALDSKRAGEAVFALERVLAVQPGNAVARALVARAYFELGETRTAKQEFEAARGQAPPAEVDTTIQRYLGEIERLESGIDTKIAGYIEGGFGYDTNVNGATAAGQIAIPVFGGSPFTLAQNGQQAHDYFASLGGGVNVRHSVTRGLSLVASFDANKRVNDTQDTFDTGFWNGFAGVNYVIGAESFTVGAQVQQYFVDNNRYRDAAGLTGQWQHAFDDFTSLTGYVQWTALDYPGQNLRDVNRTVAGVGFAKALAMDRNPVVFAGFYAGEENERNNGVPYLGHRLWGARLGGQFNFRSDLIPFASASLERRGYGGPDPLFVVTRRDIQSDFRVGVNYLPAKLWTITPQIAYTGNDSNVQINDYNRTVYFVSVRRDFR